MLKKLMAMTKAELKSTIQSIDATAVKGRALRRQLTGMKKKDGGFTLLELLVVVAILAAIAGTATTMLHDTDKKAFAAAHVGMMDGLAKGIVNFQQLNGGNYPNNWDSLTSSSNGALAATAAPSILLNEGLYTAGNPTATPPVPAGGALTPHVLTTPEFDALNAVGITQVRVLAEDAIPPDTVANACLNTEAGIRATINSKANAVTSQNIFRAAAANGCGVAVSPTIVSGNALLAWNGGNARVNAGAGDILIALGAGQDTTLFSAANYGALTNAPIYRHVANNEYNRFIVLFNVTSDPTKPTNGKATFQAVVDGAGDTKDEELGEFDNVRPT